MIPIYSTVSSELWEVSFEIQGTHIFNPICWIMGQNVMQVVQWPCQHLLANIQMH